MEWKVAAHDDNAFRAEATRAPGWYWVLRPKNLGRHAYDPDVGVLCLVHVDAEGHLLSPLADFRRLEHGDLTCLDGASGHSSDPSLGNNALDAMHDGGLNRAVLDFV